MKIGIISDTHNEEKMVDAAIVTFNWHECEKIFHIGDFERPDILKIFSKKKDNVQFVWIPGTGRHDNFKMLLLASDDIGGYCAASDGNPYGIYFDENITVSMCHSIYEKTPDNKSIMINAWARYQKNSYIFYGHTHYFNLKFPSSISSATIINPGGFYSDRCTPTVAILDSEKKDLCVYIYVQQQNFFGDACSICLKDRKVIRGKYYRLFRQAFINALQNSNLYIDQCNYVYKSNEYLCDFDENAWMSVKAIVNYEDSI